MLVRRHRDLRRGVRKGNSATCRVVPAEPVTAAHLQLIQQCLPNAGKEREHAEQMFNIMLFCWQGVLRFGDIRHMLCENIKHLGVREKGARVRYFSIEFQDKARMGTMRWRTVVIPEREDDLDAYELVKDWRAGREEGPLIPGLERSMWYSFIRSLREADPRLAKLRGHGLRCGGLADLDDVSGGDERLAVMQGGWTCGGLAEKLASFTSPSHRMYHRWTPTLIAKLRLMGKEAQLPEIILEEAAEATAVAGARKPGRKDRSGPVGRRHTTQEAAQLRSAIQASLADMQPRPSKKRPRAGAAAIARVETPVSARCGDRAARTKKK